jgi:tetratricopeptide (TPR) repeat protein
VDTEARVYGPDNINVISEMQELAITYAHEGRYREASDLFHRAIAVAEENRDATVNVAWYNFACAAAIAGQTDEAFRYLREAVDKGFVYGDAIGEDKDLASLRSDPRFTGILDEIRRRVAQKK